MMLESSVRQIEEEIHRTNDLAQSYTKRLQKVELSIAHLKQEVKDEVNQLIGNAKQWHEELLKEADTRKELESVEEGFYAKVREITELRSRISQLENLLHSHESRLSKIDELLTQHEQHAVPTNTTQQDILEGKLFSEQVMNALRSAHHSLEAPSMTYLEWLTADQRRLQPRELDVLAAVYLLGKSEIPAITTNIETVATGMQRGRITDIATGLVARELLSSIGPGNDKRRGSASRSYDLTDRGLRMFVPCGSSTGTLHRDMEMLMLEEAFRAKPAKCNLCVPQPPGQVRCDRLVIERVDSRNFNYPGATAVQVETPQEVRAHPDQITMNLLLPFSCGLQRLTVICLRESLEKLVEIKNALPSWIVKNIEIRAVEL
jgi:hypothetical protein